MDSDDKFMVAMVGMFLSFLTITFILAFITGLQKMAVETEAIKAGLVQDSEGNWVEP